jgi:adhesin HecA-like repeat protein
MKLLHTLLFLVRENQQAEDLAMARALLDSLEKSTCRTVIVYNQGYFTNDALAEYLSGFALDTHVIGDGTNAGIPAGRQSCFNFIWSHFPDTEYISELHLDMVLGSRWEDPLIDFLLSHDEPMICSGLVDSRGVMPVLGKKVPLPSSFDLYDDFLISLREDKILHGLTHPCIHVSKILKEVGGYDPVFLKGKQCFEDDSLLLGYYYYYGTRANWHPKINFNSVAYHAVAGQRMSLHDSMLINYNGLVKQYGAMGIKTLSWLKNSPWHKNYFENNYKALTGT